MADKSYHNSRYNRKRGSFDSSVKPEYSQLNKSKPRDPKRQIAELSIDLNPKKHILSLHGRNHTHRIQPNDMCELREEVQQLRMQNDCLKEEIKLLKKSEEDLKYEIMRVREDMYEKRQKYERVENQCMKMEEKVDKYSRKIKQLYESLIQEKKKNSGVAITDSSEYSRIKGAVSPSARSIVSNSMYYQKFEKEGERDYYSSLAHRNEVGNMAWSIENSQYSPVNSNYRQAHKRETFGTIF